MIFLFFFIYTLKEISNELEQQIEKNQLTLLYNI